MEPENSTPPPRFHWTIEDYGYVLRDGRNLARACVGRSLKEPGFFGVVFMTDLPDSGPYKSRREAADWVETMCIAWGHLPKDAVFSPLPEERKRRAA